MDNDKERTLEISIEMAQRNDVKTQCPRLLSLYGKEAELLTGTELGCSGCRYQIAAKEYLNCALIAGCHGPLRRNVVAEILEVGDKQLRTIEENAMNSFKLGVMGESGKDLKNEIDKQTRLAKLRETDMATDIDILQAIVERYELERKSLARGG